MAPTSAGLLGKLPRAARLLRGACPFVLALAVAACGDRGPGGLLYAPVEAPPPAEGRGGMVSSAHPLATEAGIQVLRSGGNAFDAAVAVAAALGVVEPMMSGVGGYGTLLIYSAREGRVRFLNASGRIPRGVKPEVFRTSSPGFEKNRRGAKAVSTPGNVSAWAALWGTYGSVPWSALLEPAIRLAEEGFPVDERLSGLIAQAWDELPPHARAFYGPEGRPLEPGGRLIQRDLGRTLRLLADQGPDVFYRGELADAIHAAMVQEGGFLAKDDLERHESEWWDPIEMEYRGYRVVVPSPPANAFPALVRLGILGQFDLRSLRHNSPDYLHLFAEVTKMGYWVRLRYAGDPEVNPPPLDTLLSPAYWKDLARRVNREEAVPFAFPRAGDPTTAHTTHFVVADSQGNVVSATQTLGQAFGSRIMPPGTGIWLNNSLAYSTFDPPGNPMDAHPGRRKLSGDVPLFVMKEGRPWIALGTPGGHTIDQTVPQMVVNVLDFGMNLAQAVAAPRIAFAEPDILLVEETLPAEVVRALRFRGHAAVRIEALGNAHALMVEWGPGGRPVRFWGVADPRGKGLALGL